MKRSMITLAAAAASALVLAACGSAQTVDGGATASSTIVVGSQDYYSNEIIAEVYAQALEGAGSTVDRQMRIGQREVYMPELDRRLPRVHGQPVAIPGFRGVRAILG